MRQYTINVNLPVEWIFCNKSTRCIPHNLQCWPTTLFALVPVMTAPCALLFHGDYNSSSAAPLSSGGKDYRIEGFYKPMIIQRSSYCCTVTTICRRTKQYGHQHLIQNPERFNIFCFWSCQSKDLAVRRMWMIFSGSWIGQTKGRPGLSMAAFVSVFPVYLHDFSKFIGQGQGCSDTDLPEGMRKLNSNLCALKGGYCTVLE